MAAAEDSDPSDQSSDGMDMYNSPGIAIPWIRTQISEAAEVLCDRGAIEQRLK